MCTVCFVGPGSSLLPDVPCFRRGLRIECVCSIVAAVEEKREESRKSREHMHQMRTEHAQCMEDGFRMT